MGANILQDFKYDTSHLLQKDNFDNFFSLLDIMLEFDNVYEYIKYYENKTCTIKNIDNYIDYLFLWKQSQFLEASSMIKEEKKDEYTQAYKKINELFKNYKISDIINYINSDFQVICDDYAVAYMTFKFIENKNKGIHKQVYIEIAEKQPIVWFNNLLQNIKFLKLNLDIVEILLQEENIKKLLMGMCDLLFHVIIELNKHNEFHSICKRVENYIEAYIDKFEENSEEINVFEMHDLYTTYCEFLKNIKSNAYNKNFIKLNNYKTLLNEELIKNGQHFVCGINGIEIEKLFGHSDPEFEILQLTHDLNRTSFFEKIMDDEIGIGLLNVFGSNIPHNDFFTISKQNILNKCTITYIAIMAQYLNIENRRIDFFSLLKSNLKKVCTELNINIETKNFNMDLSIIEKAYCELLNSIKSNDDIMSKLLSYSIMSYGCSFIEKLLREIYITLDSKDSYIDLNGLTLGDLLNTKNEIILDILGYKQIRCLRYFLHKDENEVGENLRNRIAHMKYISTNDFNWDLSLKVIWLTLSIMNSLSIKYIN